MTERKRTPQFHRGQEVTVGRYGHKVYVLDSTDGQVICVDPETGAQATYPARQLFKL